MLGLGLSEILFIGIVVLLVIGPERLPHFMRHAGRVYGQVRRASDDLRRAFVLEADRMDAEERYSKLQERRKQAEEARRQALANAGPGVMAQDRVPLSTEGAAAIEDTDPESPAPMIDLPPGVTPEEWRSLPPSVRDILRKAQKDGA